MTTTAQDIDSAMSSLKTAIASYATANGNQVVLASWLVSQLKQSDAGVARALDTGITRMVANAPDARTFASIG
jgi:hypothetical protein